MSDYVITQDSLQLTFYEFGEKLKSQSCIMLTETNPDTGKWGMSRLWRSWMAKTGKYMADNGITMPLYVKKDGTHCGKRRFNAEDAHELFTSRWLGLDKNGVRLSWAKKPHDDMIPADKGQRFLAMLQHEEFCLERGILLFRPNDSEFAILSREQNK